MELQKIPAVKTLKAFVQLKPANVIPGISEKLVDGPHDCDKMGGEHRKTAKRNPSQVIRKCSGTIDLFLQRFAPKLSGMRSVKVLHRHLTCVVI